jgi:hypothetical protein
MDFLGSGETIKQLFCLPYTQDTSNIFAFHRMGNALFLDSMFVGDTMNGPASTNSNDDVAPAFGLSNTQNPSNSIAPNKSSRRREHSLILSMLANNAASNNLLSSIPPPPALSQNPVQTSSVPSNLTINPPPPSHLAISATNSVTTTVVGVDTNQFLKPDNSLTVLGSPDSPPATYYMPQPVPEPPRYNRLSTAS